MEVEDNTQLSFWRKKSKDLATNLPRRNLSLFNSRLGSAEEKPNERRFNVHFVYIYKRESLFWNGNLSIGIVLSPFYPNLSFRWQPLRHDLLRNAVWVKVTPFFTVTRKTSGAMPNGFVIKDFQVEQTGNNWTISLLPAKCGSPLPLLAVVDALKGNSSKDKATYTAKGLTSNVQITRIQKASPRVRGTFEIEYNGKVLRGGWNWWENIDLS